MNYFLTEEQEMIRDLARQIAEERIKPVRAELDEKEEFPRDLMKALAQADLFGLIIPEEYGGLGGGCLEKRHSRGGALPGLRGGFHHLRRLFSGLLPHPALRL